MRKCKKTLFATPAKSTPAVPKKRDKSASISKEKNRGRPRG